MCSSPSRYVSRYRRTPMKAAVHTRYGPPDVVRIADVDKPTGKDHEVLVKVHVTTVNRTDCGFRSGKPFIVRFFSGLLRPKGSNSSHLIIATVQKLRREMLISWCAKKLIL